MQASCFEAMIRYGYQRCSLGTSVRVNKDWRIKEKNKVDSRIKQTWKELKRWVKKEEVKDTVYMNPETFVT